jgi:hypothetical protein
MHDETKVSDMRGELARTTPPARCCTRGPGGGWGRSTGLSRLVTRAPRAARSIARAIRACMCNPPESAQKLEKLRQKPNQAKPYAR